MNEVYMNAASQSKPISTYQTDEYRSPSEVEIPAGHGLATHVA